MSAAHLIVGLSGGIGSGKSAAAAFFGAQGAALVDTDAIAHELTAAGGMAMPALREAFGEGVVGIDGALNRPAMRALAFAEPSVRVRLEAILHPLIRAESERQCRAAGGPYVMLVVPLLIESGSFRERVHRVCIVDCPEALQVARVMARSRLEEVQVRAIMAAQASRAARLAAADDVIDNAGDLEALQAQVATLHGGYLRLAAGGGQALWAL